MNLEDHLGDIIRKAATMNGVPAAKAASAAGISENELATLEETGKSPAKINLPALAQTVGLDPKKLSAIADGWLPVKADLSIWREIRVITTKDDELTVNCYLVWDEVTRDAALFDTGVDAAPILDLIATEGLTLRHIFITHSHYDHVEALPKVPRGLSQGSRAQQFEELSRGSAE